MRVQVFGPSLLLFWGEHCMRIKLVKIFHSTLRLIMTASNVSSQVVDDSLAAPAPLPSPPPTTNSPVPDAASAANPGVIAGSVIGSIACKPWQPQPCTNCSRI